MNMGPRLDLRQSQQLVMTPQLQQAIKLLALSNLEIETFVGEALEANPLLELGEQGGEDAPSETEITPPPAPEGSIGEAEAPLDIDPDVLDRDTGAGAMLEYAGSGETGGGGQGPGIEERGSGSLSLSEHLIAQIGLCATDEQQAAMARYLVGLLDEAGYLPVSVREVAMETGLPSIMVEEGLALIHTLDPTGVGARDLAECLALQAKEADRYDPCMARLIDNLDLLAKGNVKQLKRICEVDDEDFADMLAELRGYDPKPGLQFSVEPDGAPVVPDILLRAAKDGGWDIAINPDTLPRLVINRSYYVELRRECDDRQARGWLSEKLADANWLVKALDQRQKTILKVAAEIVKQQDGFFRKGVSELKPLTLRAVAEAIDMHESTVSRVTSNKYLNCARGTFELKYFFTSGVASADGESTVSAEAVKAQIRALIDAEDADDILSDDKLVELLREKGFDLARRTVAKYREAIGLGSSVQRRRARKLEAVR
ncbi:MAG: polymerase sigma-54 factor [Pseudomonadota bacterium]|jgi:RNA polymerase sigma-54 factor